MCHLELQRLLQVVKNLSGAAIDSTGKLECQECLFWLCSFEQASQVTFMLNFHGKGSVTSGMIPLR